MYVWASADREGQRWFLYPSAYPDPGIDSPSYTEDKDSPFQQESLQILSAAEVGASPFLLPFLLQALQTGLCAIHKERSHFSEFSFVCKIWSGKKYKLPITIKTHAVINDQTDKQIPCWKFSEVWDWFILFSTEVRVALLKIAVSANSLPTPPHQWVLATAWREDREQ